MTRFRHLPEMVRQIVILTVGARFGTAYEIYAHGAVALANGMRAGRLATIAAGLRPADLTSEEGIGYDMATALLGGGTLASPIWERARRLRWRGDPRDRIPRRTLLLHFNDTERLCDFRP